MVNNAEKFKGRVNGIIFIGISFFKKRILNSPHVRGVYELRVLKKSTQHGQIINKTKSWKKNPD